ncbi:hypothetical protein [Endozoicomonas sp. NE40]|uniref:Organic radical activating enzyme n=1 Tax=Endozoicomonas lisbonensis TaxID=3120522 RepID=A0ABV2SII3_9GAMM
MDSVQTASSPLHESGASTSFTCPEPASTGSHHTSKSWLSRKRKSLPPVEHDQVSPDNQPVKKRRVKLVKQTNETEEDKRKAAVAKHRSESQALKVAKRNAMKEVEQWLKDKDIDTESLKPTDTEVEKVSQYEKILHSYKDRGDETAILCQSALGELAEVFCDFKWDPKRESKTKTVEKNTKQLNQSIRKTKKLKKLITLNEKNYNKLINLRKMVVSKFCTNNSTNRNRNYAKALYSKAQPLIESLPENERTNMNEKLDLLGRLAGLTQKPKRKNNFKSANWVKERDKKIKEACDKLENILLEKYNIRIVKNSHFNLIHIAKESIELLKQHGQLPAKTYTQKEFKEFTNRDKRTEKTKKDSKEYSKEHRIKINNALLGLQACLGSHFINSYGNADFETTILAACDFLDKHKPDPQLPIPTQEAAEEAPQTQPALPSTSLSFEPKESACSSKHIYNLRKELAYAELREAIKRWPVFPNPIRDKRELICATEYCIKSIQWTAPITYEAYQRFLSSQQVSKDYDSTPEESINKQLDSLKKQLMEVAIHSERIEKKAGH